ncbi:hypothetical protein A9Q99_18220 [Gammaproteobacteria bacterium 45_16_T64]|nr:hypothetical protein A9Q99_18220 [Gammaproteobacteria bacterium 45_16_T64]
MTNLSKMFLLLITASLASHVNAVVIMDLDAGVLDGAYVGSLDTYLIEGPKQGSTTSEETWVQSNGFSDLFFTGTKDEPVTYYDTDTANVIAFMLPDSPDYFLIKNAEFNALFQNNSLQQWGVFDITDLSEDFNIAIGKNMISHVTNFDDITTEIPEPNTLLLIFMGLILLGRFRTTNS